MPSTKANAARRLPVGAEVMAGGTHLRVWAPACRTVEAVFKGGASAAVPLRPEGGGYFSALAPGRGAGDLYRFRLDGGDLLPDPAARFLPQGPHGPAEVVDSGAFAWTDDSWPGLILRGQAFYEMHVGTWTESGTWAAAEARLAELADLGITAVEVMPVAEAPGRFNWGYDGVGLYAPTRNYGRPDDFRRFVDRAHAVGLGVILDVVYNHLGPDGNYLRRFSGDYFTRRHKTDWGEAINYDGDNSGPVREFMAANAAYWISEYHLDGLRVDATQNIYDDSPRSILAELTSRARAAAGKRRILMIAENESQQARLVSAVLSGGCGFDALWNDDFHHSFRVALTGRREAYYADYRGAPQELLSCLKRGFLYQGQWYTWQRQRRGTPSAGVPAEAFVSFLENHDQVANSTAEGRRLVSECSPARLRAATAVLLLGPNTPLLFQGQERGARQPFCFFADHKAGLSELVAKGRRAFLAQFPRLAVPQAQAAIPDPADEAAFKRCRPARDNPADAARWLALHRDLLRLRRADSVIAAQRADRLDGAVLGAAAFCVRFFGPAGDDRLLLVNLGPELSLGVMPEPLLAPPPGSFWETLWSSESPRYGGDGTPPLDERVWTLDAESARLLRPAGEALDAAA